MKEVKKEKKSKTPLTDIYIRRGIEMRKIKELGYSGWLGSKPTLYDVKTVYDLDEAVSMNNEGWEFSNGHSYVMGNLALFLWRDLNKS